MKENIKINQDVVLNAKNAQLDNMGLLKLQQTKINVYLVKSVHLLVLKEVTRNQIVIVVLLVHMHHKKDQLNVFQVIQEIL